MTKPLSPLYGGWFPDSHMKGKLRVELESGEIVVLSYEEWDRREALRQMLPKHREYVKYMERHPDEITLKKLYVPFVGDTTHEQMAALAEDLKAEGLLP